MKIYPGRVVSFDAFAPTVLLIILGSLSLTFSDGFILKCYLLQHAWQYERDQLSAFSSTPSACSSAVLTKQLMVFAWSSTHMYASGKTSKTFCAPSMCLYILTLLRSSGSSSRLRFRASNVNEITMIYQYRMTMTLKVIAIAHLCWFIMFQPPCLHHHRWDLHLPPPLWLASSAPTCMPKIRQVPQLSRKWEIWEI